MSSRGTANPSRRGRGLDRRNMNLIASPSRSSGLEKDGDTLKDFRVQKEYREFIQEKLDNYWKRFPLSATERDGEPDQRREVEQNILILFRKLREGISSSRREDQFALEVYETSLSLAILFWSPLQATSTLSYLLPRLYLASSSEDLRRTGRLSTILISLLHHLVSAYPSQSTFHQHLKSLPSSFLSLNSDGFTWISSISSTLRSHNYARFEVLTQLSSFASLLEPSSLSPVAKSCNRRSDPQLSNEAMYTLVDALCAKARSRTWQILRTAYREFSCQHESATVEWLSRSLTLRSVRYKGSLDMQGWLIQREKDGDVRKKEGIEGRWVVCKPKP